MISANNKLLWQKSNIIITVIIYLTDHIVHIADISILKLHHLNWKFPMFCKKHWCWNDIFMKLNKWIPLMSWINPVGAFKSITYHQLTLYNSNREKCLILFHKFSVTNLKTYIFILRYFKNIVDCMLHKIRIMWQFFLLKQQIGHQGII